MSASVELLDRAKSAKGLTSDYSLAQALGWSRQYVSNLRTGHRALTVEYVEQLAKFAGFSLPECIAMIESENAPTPGIRAAYAVIAERLAA